jgi:hypothetical protein
MNGAKYVVKAAVVKGKEKTVADVVREARGDNPGFDVGVRDAGGGKVELAVLGSPSNTMLSPSAEAIKTAQLERTKLETHSAPTVADVVRAATAEAFRAQAEAGGNG